MARLPREPRLPPGSIQRTDRMVIPPSAAGTLGDPGEADFAHRLRTQLLDWSRMNIGAFAREAWRVKLLTADDTDALTLLLYKFLNGGWRKLSELHKGAGLDPDGLEVHVVETWGQGRYRLTPEWRGKTYAPDSRGYDLGVDPLTGAPKKDTAALIAEATEEVRQVVTLSQLNALKTPTEDDGMKVGDLAQLITALRGGERAGPDPLMTDLLRRNEEAQRAILDELKTLRTSGRNPSELAALLPALAPMLGTLLKPFARNPDALVGMLGKLMGVAPPAAEKGWLDGLMELVGPALQSPTAQAILQALTQRLVASPVGAPAPAAEARMLPASAAPGDGYAPRFFPAAPAPAAAPLTNPPEETGPMPIALNVEQSDAVAQLTAYIAAGDFANGYAALELFPASDPLPPLAPLGVNLGELFLERLHQAITGTAAPVDPRVAVPALRALAPSLDPQRAAEFIAYCQTRLLDETEKPPVPGSAES